MPTAETRRTLHVYNARCALTVDPCRNRRGDVHTVNLETAARDGGAGEFDWANKIVVQLTEEELPDVLATLLGHLPNVEFGFHGAARNKGFRLFRDGDRFVVQVFAGSAGGDRHTVTLNRADRLRVSVALFRQLQRNHGGLPADVLYAMIDEIYAEARTGSASVPASESSEPKESSAEPIRSTAAPSSKASDAYDW